LVGVVVLDGVVVAGGPVIVDVSRGGRTARGSPAAPRLPRSTLVDRALGGSARSATGPLGGRRVLMGLLALHRASRSSIRRLGGTRWVDGRLRLRRGLLTAGLALPAVGPAGRRSPLGSRRPLLRAR